MTTYEIRDAAGIIHAIHERRDLSDGKRIAWRLPGRAAYGLGGRRVETLPLYGSERATSWPLNTWIVVCEGESDTDALIRLNVPALGTVTGAPTVPTVEALADVARGRRFVTWPDNDGPGRQHMVQVGANLYRAGAVDVRNVTYRPETIDWPKGAGARDLVGDAEPDAGAFLIAWLLEDWSLPVGRPGPFITVRPSRTQPMGDTASVSDALIARGVLNARPGRTVRCPAHQDRSASLSILRDDRRAICKSASCIFAGPLTTDGRSRGVIASDVLALVPA